MADKNVTVTTTGPNGEDFTFYSLPEGFADFSTLDDAQKQHLMSIMDRATREGLNSVNYELFMSNENRAQSVTSPTDAAQNPPLFSRERIANAWNETKEAVTDVVGAVNRGLGPAAVGAAAGAPFGPAGAAAGALAVPAADLLVEIGNAAFGKDWATPSETIKGLIDRMGAGDVPETAIMRWWENAVEQVGQTAAFSGLMRILGSTPGAAKSGQATRIDPGGQPTGFGPQAGTSGPASVPVTRGRDVAANMSLGLPGQMIGAGSGAMAEQGSRQFLIDRGMKPEWADLLSSAVGTTTDVITGGVADRIGLRRAASEAPLGPRVQRQAELAEEFGSPLRPDEALGNPANDPSVRELTGVARRASTAQGSGDYMQERIRNARDAGLRMADDYGVQYRGDMQGVEDVTPEVMNIFNAARNDEVRTLWQQKRNIIETISNADDPVDVSRTLEVIDRHMDRFARLGANMFGDAGRRLSGIASDLRSPHSLEDIETIRKALFAMKGDELVPQGARGELDEAIDDIYSTLREDMGSFIRNAHADTMTNFGPLQVVGTEIEDIWRTVDSKLADYMQDFRYQDIDRMINEAATKPIEFQSVQAVQDLHRANRDPAQYRRLYRELDEEGRRLSEAAIFGNIVEAAGGPLVASPTEMARAMDEYMPMLDAIAQEQARSAGGSLDPDLPNIKEQAEHYVSYVRNVVDWVEGFVGSGLTTSRLNLSDHPTGGIALSQGSRRLGLAGALFIGDLLQGGAGTMARRLNKPENLRRVMNIRNMEYGSPAWVRATRSLLQDVYQEALNEEEDESVPINPLEESITR